MIESWFLILGGGWLVLGVAAIVNAVFFHYRYQKDIDKRVMKDGYYDGGLLFNLLRVMMYGHYCLFPKRAKRDNVNEVFSTLSKTVRFHLIFHWVAFVTAFLLMFVTYFVGRYIDAF
jgi:hypothetical protein